MEQATSSTVPSSTQTTAPPAAQLDSAQLGTQNQQMSSTLSEGPTHLDSHLAQNVSYLPEKAPIPTQRQAMARIHNSSIASSKRATAPTSFLDRSIAAGLTTEKGTFKTQHHPHRSGTASNDSEMVLLSRIKIRTPQLQRSLLRPPVCGLPQHLCNAVSLEKFGDVAAFLGYFTALCGHGGVRLTSTFATDDLRILSRFSSSRASVSSALRARSVGRVLHHASEFSRGSFTNFTQIYGYSRLGLALDYAVVWPTSRAMRRDRRSVATDDLATQDIPLEQLHSRHLNTITSNPERHRTKFGRVVQTHLISIAALISSGLLWILSRFIRHRGIKAPLLIMWIVGVGIEASAQIVNEIGGALSPLGKAC